MPNVTFTEDIKRLLREKGRDEGIKEIRRHASVSRDNHHYCTTCFCCACVDWLHHQGLIKHRKPWEAYGPNGWARRG